MAGTTLDQDKQYTRSIHWKLKPQVALQIVQSVLNNEFLKRLVRGRTVENILVDRKRLIGSVSA